MEFLASHLLVFRFGRTKTLLTSLTLTVVSGVLVCVSPYPTIFIITQFFLAAASSGVYLTLYIIREYFPLKPKHPSNQTGDLVCAVSRGNGTNLLFVWQVWSCVNLL